MKIAAFVFLFLSAILSCSAQPDGYYFENIRGTAWIKSLGSDTQPLLTTKEFGLSLLQAPLDSLKSSVQIWTFDEKLLISDYNSTHKLNSPLVECVYEIDEENRILLITMPDSRNSVLRFGYVSTSIGNFILFR